MLLERTQFALVSYADTLFAFGGYRAGHGNNGDTNTAEKYTRATGWSYIANMPYNNHRYKLK